VDIDQAERGRILKALERPELEPRHNVVVYVLLGVVHAPYVDKYVAVIEGLRVVGPDDFGALVLGSVVEQVAGEHFIAVEAEGSLLPGVGGD